uniref:Methylenetetrahydrofolate reductase (NAD(P)H) n=1 Tax=Auxenochlorella protothecoides TaxID=3075 RepID=A0A1D2A210_AUXPR
MNWRGVTSRHRSPTPYSLSRMHASRVGPRLYTRSARFIRRLASTSLPQDGNAVPLPRPLLLTLERKVGREAGSDEELWRSGAFGAGVVPDLPPATTLRQLAAQALRLPGGHVAESPTTAPPATCRAPAGLTPQQPPGCITVRSVAAQLRSREDLRRRMAAAVAGSEGHPPAQALLLLSGGHPVRTLPIVPHFLGNSLSMLRDAGTARSRGELPADTRLWAVANPGSETLRRLAAKVEAGASTVLTQPPLLWRRSREWMERAAENGLTHRARIVLGVPLITSRSNLEFWLFLIGAGAGDEEAAQLLADFPASQDAEGVRAWNADLIRRTLDLPGVGGLHVMPLTKRARQLTQGFLQDGTLPKSCPGVEA